MKYFNTISIIVMLAGFLTVSCSIFRKKNDSCLGIKISMGTVGQSGEFILEKGDTIIICSTDNLNLYRESTESIDYNQKAFRNGRIEFSDDVETINSRTYVHQFYAFINGEKYGLSYNFDQKILKGIPFDLDSLLARNPIFKGGNTEYDENSVLFFKAENPSGVVTEKYIYPDKPSEDFPDSVLLYFDKNWQTNSNYSLSKSLDSLKKMKLTRIQIVLPEKGYAKDSSKKHAKKIIDFQIFKPILTKTELDEINNITQIFKKENTEKQHH